VRLNRPSISDISEHSEESDILSLTDSDVIAHVRKQPLRFIRARSKRSGSRQRAFGSLRGNYFLVFTSVF